MPTQLSEQARNILQLIAEGYTFEQILTDYSASHIQTAAHEALAIDAATHPSIHPPNKRVKRTFVPMRCGQKRKILCCWKE
ncbi:MAG: hypothetical protein Q9P01_02260 [Anaerolineae bacterium]|nr:hypothetical protein [Anaerolineae bacterium]